MIVFRNIGSGTTTVSPTTASVIINVGDTVVIAMTADGSGISVNDDGGNTYTLQGFISNTKIYTSLNVANPATIITVTFTGGTLCVLVPATYIGVSAIGNVATTSPNGQTTATIDLAIRAENNFAVAALDCLAGSPTITYTSTIGNLRGTQISVTNMRMMGLSDNTSTIPGIVTNAVLVNKTVNPRNVAIELIAQISPVNVFGYISVDC